MQGMPIGSQIPHFMPALIPPQFYHPTIGVGGVNDVMPMSQTGGVVGMNGSTTNHKQDSVNITGLLMTPVCFVWWCALAPWSPHLLVHHINLIQVFYIHTSR